MSTRCNLAVVAVALCFMPATFRAQDVPAKPDDLFNEEVRGLESFVNTATLSDAGELGATGASRAQRNLLEVISVRPFAYPADGAEPKLIFDKLLERHDVRRVLDDLGAPKGAWDIKGDAVVARLGAEVAKRLAGLKQRFPYAGKVRLEAIEADKRIFESLPLVLRAFDAVNSARVEHHLPPVSWSWVAARAATLAARDELRGTTKPSSRRSGGTDSRPMTAIGGDRTGSLAVEDVLAARLHGSAVRLLILDPLARWIGLGGVAGARTPLVAVVRSEPLRNPDATRLVSSPPDKGKAVPPSIPEQGGGFPILLIGVGPDAPFSAPVITVQDSRGRAIAFRTEEHAAPEGSRGEVSSALVIQPTAALPGGTTVRVKVTWQGATARRELSWSFQTADPSVGERAEKAIGSKEPVTPLSTYDDAFEAEAKLLVDGLISSGAIAEARAMAMAALDHGEGPHAAIELRLQKCPAGKGSWSGGAAAAKIAAFGERMKTRLAEAMKATPDLDAAQKRRLNAERDVLAALAPCIEAYARLNDHLVQSGAPEIRWSWELASGARLHSLYGQRHRVLTAEDETKEGYTPEGAAAMTPCYFGLNAAVLNESLIWKSVNQRLFFLGNVWTRIGIGQATGGSVDASVFATKDRAAAGSGPPAIFVMPADKAIDVPTHGDLTYDGAGQARSVQGGFPITLTGALGYEALTGADAQLFSDNGNTVPCIVWTPSTADAPGWFTAMNSVAMLPKQPLRPGMRYRAVFTWESPNGERARREITFTTARAQK